MTITSAGGPDTSQGYIPIPHIAPTALGTRVFADEAIQGQLDRILAEQVPDDHNLVVVTTGIDPQGLTAVAVVRLKSGWSVAGALDKRFAGDWSGRLELRGSW